MLAISDKCWVLRVTTWLAPSTQHGPGHPYRTLEDCTGNRDTRCEIPYYVHIVRLQGWNS